MLEKALQVFKQYESEGEVIFSRKIESTVQKTIGCPKAKRVSQIDCLHGTFTSKVSEEKVKMITKALSSKQINVRLYRHPQLGEPFQDYGEFDNFYGDKKTMLAHEPGEVLFLNICRLTRQQSLQSLDSNQQVLQKHPHWQGRVRTLAIFIDGDLKEIELEIQKRKWSLIIHLFGSNQINLSRFIQDFNTWRCPVNILIDKSGKITYIGSPDQIDLEKSITQLLHQQSSNEHMVPEYSSLPEEETLKYISSLSPERMQDQSKELELLCFQLSINMNYFYGQTTTKGQINATIINNDQTAFEKAHSFFGNYPGIDLKIKSVDYITVPYAEGARCWQCSQHLEYPFYWLKWEEGTKFGCRRCVEETTTLESHHFKYEKNSILLMGEWRKLAVKNIGYNIQPIHPKQIQNRHSYGCDGCGSGEKQIGKARYICQGCRMDPNPYWNGYRDFCEDCLEKTFKNQLKMSQQLESQGHQFNHPFLRVLYNVLGYRSF